MFVQVLERRRR
ncbi:hypothetical protein RDI58_011036 [Solanum bulbocastanum]|uniref:Uncharacterized protein n=1 Tax=Solanum bulbocastanum TaxID=147425 RepID=A0AAN8TRP7_SOLBU